MTSVYVCHRVKCPSQSTAGPAKKGITTCRISYQKSCIKRKQRMPSHLLDLSNYCIHSAMKHNEASNHTFIHVMHLTYQTTLAIYSHSLKVLTTTPWHTVTVIPYTLVAHPHSCKHSSHLIQSIHPSIVQHRQNKTYKKYKIETSYKHEIT